jgi:hypothetical protein
VKKESVYTLSLSWESNPDGFTTDSLRIQLLYRA